MHKATILLTKAENQEDAREKIREFMEGHKDSVWDWYVIGGRWSGTLSRSKFDKDKLEALTKEFGEMHEWITSLQKPEESQRKAYEKMFTRYFPDWKDKVPAPLAWRDSYNDEGYSDDIMPLEECLSVVRDWVQDPEKAGKKEQARAEESYGEKAENPNLNMYGYCLEKAGRMYQQDFCFDCDVFNTEAWNYNLPTSTHDIWAVMIDMHN